ncbi:hypothetical protein DPX39_110042700 [Trypanosoma brucei equiperdum]|uniref:Uncharacterized protein n=1 Tax=Trypanosoma brucei equiperdum TaxID=630700 RepID=A0A3L6KUZ5_9TRYP|nr:hypothetical protein DPX39_110042700 [Trypanosoma brucei equiperdum]
MNSVASSRRPHYIISPLLSIRHEDAMNTQLRDFKGISGTIRILVCQSPQPPPFRRWVTGHCTGMGADGGHNANTDFSSAQVFFRVDCFEASCLPVPRAVSVSGLFLISVKIVLLVDFLYWFILLSGVISSAALSKVVRQRLPLEFPPGDAGHLNVVPGSSTPYHRGKPRASSVPFMGNTAVLRLRHHTAQGSAPSCWGTVLHLSVPGHVPVCHQQYHPR